jgi:putative protease
MRRELTSRIDSDRVHRHQPTWHVSDGYSLELPRSIPTVDTPKLWLRVKTLDQLRSVDLSTVDRVVVPLDETVRQESLPEELRSRLVVQPPRYVVDEEDTSSRLHSALELGVEHLLCNNLTYLTIGAAKGFTLHGDYGLNVLNSLSLDTLRRLGCVDGVVSFELKLSQIERLQKSIPIGIEVYGRLPLMLVRNCPIQNEVGCKGCRHYLSDRTGRKFPVYCSYGRQYSEVYNAETVSIADRLSALRNVDYYVLSFLEESPQEVAEVVESVRAGRNVGTTKGLYVRGIL